MIDLDEVLNSGYSHQTVIRMAKELEAAREVVEACRIPWNSVAPTFALAMVKLARQLEGIKDAVAAYDETIDDKGATSD